MINCEVNRILTWSKNCVIVYTDVENQNAPFETNKKTFYVPVVTLSTQDNAKLLQQLKSDFKRMISWNKYLSKSKLLARNSNSNYIVEPTFQEINRLHVLTFEDDGQRLSNKKYYLRNVEIKDYNFVIDGKNFFDQPVKNNKTTYENIRKIATAQGDDYTTGYLLEYGYFRDNYKMIAIDLSKQ